MSLTRGMWLEYSIYGQRRQGLAKLTEEKYPGNSEKKS